MAWVVGWPLIGIGLTLITWAVWTLGDLDSRLPSSLVTSGPYAHSRNPMYVGWTVMYLGIAMVVNTLWLIALAPAVAAISHRVVRKEERELGDEFGDEYREYRRKVRRYV